MRIQGSLPTRTAAGPAFWSLLSLFLFMLTAGPAEGAPFPVRALPGRNGVTRLAMEDVAAFYGLRQSQEGKTVLWHGSRDSARFTLERRQAVINGVIVHLSNAIGQHQGRPVIGEIDFRLLLDPLLRPPSLPRQRVRTVMIDPGHGGRDPGAVGRNHQEKEVVLQISLRLARILQQRGFNVILTRSGDEFISLSRRVEKTNAAGADLFISIHANAAENQSVHGVETFLLSPQGAAETASSYVTTRPHPGNRFNKQNLRLAYDIQSHLLKQTQGHDRGVKHADFQVLRGLDCPGVLVEVGFMSNRREEERLGDWRYQHRIALGIAEGISAYRQVTASPGAGF